MNDSYGSFAEYYPDYLEQHTRPPTRWLHFLGTAYVIFTLIFVLLTRQWRLLFLVPIFAYGFAWIGHLIFEKNEPATFRHMLYNLRADFVLFGEMIRGRRWR